MAISLLGAAQQEALSANSEAAADRKGYEPSLYQGDWYTPKAESCRKAIMRRESHFFYGAQNPTSSAQGAYQFLDNKWRDGLVWMMLDESKDNKDGLGKDIRSLRDKPIKTWNRYFQDRAFYTAWRFGEGASHWAPVPCKVVKG